MPNLGWGLEREKGRFIITISDMPNDKPMDPRDRASPTNPTGSKIARESTDAMDKKAEEYEPSIIDDDHKQNITPSYRRTPVPFNLNEEMDITRRELSIDESTIERATDQEAEVIDHIKTTMVHCHFPSQDEGAPVKSKPAVYRTHIEYGVDIFACDSSWLWNAFSQTVACNRLSHGVQRRMSTIC